MKSSNCDDHFLHLFTAVINVTKCVVCQVRLYEYEPRILLECSAILVRFVLDSRGFRDVLKRFSEASCEISGSLFSLHLLLFLDATLEDSR